MPLIALILLGAVLRFALLGHQGLWQDESYTYYLVHLSLPRMYREIPRTESTPPLYYTILWFWSRIFGGGAAGLRSLSALCGTLTIPAVWLAAVKLGAKRRVALVVAALTAFNPLLIWYSQEARAYSMLVLASCLVLVTFSLARANPSRRNLWLWALAGAVALLTHYYAVLVVLPTGAWLLYENWNSRELRKAAGALIALGVLLLPLLIIQSTSGNQSWIAGIPLSLRLSQIPTMALIGPVTQAHDTLKWIAYAAAACGFLLLALRVREPAPVGPGAASTPGAAPIAATLTDTAIPAPPQPHSRFDPRRLHDGANVALALAVAGLLLSAVGWVLDDSFLARNLLGIWPAAALALAFGLGVKNAKRIGTKAQWLGLTATVALCVVGVVAVIGVDTHYGLQRPQWSKVAAALGPAPTDNTNRLIVVIQNPAAYPLSVYMPRIRYVGDHTVENVSEIDIVVARVISRGKMCWWGSACNLAAGNLQVSYALTGFTKAGPIIYAKQFSIMRLRAATPQSVTVPEIKSALHAHRWSRDTYIIQRP